MAFRFGETLILVVYRVDKLTECDIDPITGCGYDSSWIVLMLTDSAEYQFMCGSIEHNILPMKTAIRMDSGFLLVRMRGPNLSTARSRRLLSPPINAGMAIGPASVLPTTGSLSGRAFFVFSIIPRSFSRFAYPASKLSVYLL